MSISGDQTWAVQALCVDILPDQLSVQRAAQREVCSICLGCPVRIECLADALDSRVLFGVWGGLTERECRAMLRNHPEVKSWEKWSREADDTLAEKLRTKYAPHILAYV